MMAAVIVIETGDESTPWAFPETPNGISCRIFSAKNLQKQGYIRPKKPAMAIAPAVTGYANPAGSVSRSLVAP